MNKSVPYKECITFIISAHNISAPITIQASWICSLCLFACIS